MVDAQNRSKSNTGLIHEQPIIETGQFAGWRRCWRRNNNCHACDHKYSKDEYDLWECPECGFDRHCRTPVPRAGDACRMHGGTSLKGDQHPNFKHGGYSGSWEPTWEADYETFLEDPERLQVDYEMATVRVLLKQEIEDIKGGGSSSQWRRAKAVYENALRAHQARNSRGFSEQFNELGRILSEGAERRERLSEVRKLSDQVRKLVDTQRQIYVDMGQLVMKGMVLNVWRNFLDVLEKRLMPIEGGEEIYAEVYETAARVFGPIDAAGVGGQGQDPLLLEGELAD